MLAMNFAQDAVVSSSQAHKSLVVHKASNVDHGILFYQIGRVVVENVLIRNLGIRSDESPSSLNFFDRLFDQLFADPLSNFFNQLCGGSDESPSYLPRLEFFHVLRYRLRGAETSSTIDKLTIAINSSTLAYVHKLPQSLSSSLLLHQMVAVHRRYSSKLYDDDP
ncbi:unnamed protein product [Cuscuta campestris]|uniref:Uncharacterized protein n=1 Tax=Cuscuta campestris TaxID=132261 RepID=A0A484LIM1_9ASTE|nr:unnamed protein product [Cuscuta campestris]